MAQPLVARLAERLGLPCNPSSAVDIARDKKTTRTVTQSALEHMLARLSECSSPMGNCAVS